MWLSTIPFGVIALGGALFVRDLLHIIPTNHVSVTLEKPHLDLEKTQNVATETQHVESIEK